MAKCLLVGPGTQHVSTVTASNAGELAALRTKKLASGWRALTKKKWGAYVGADGDPDANPDHNPAPTT